VYFELPAVALFGLAGAWFALRARWLWGDVQRMAELMPPKPKRTQAHWIMRLYWWIARRQMQRAAQPKPWRGVKVDGVVDAVKLPRQPQEMAQASEPAIVHGYTAKDIYAIVCEPSTRGLGDRAWQFDTRTVKLPSGQNLSREGFRDVKGWLYDRKLAVKSPAWDLTVTPEAVAAELEKVK